MSRKRLLNRPRLLQRLLGQVGVHGVDSGLEAMKDAKRREWRQRGYPEKLINMAVTLADEWTASLTEAFTPPELRETMTRHLYPKGLETAERWITKLAGS